MLIFGIWGGSGEFDPAMLLLLAMAFEAYLGRPDLLHRLTGRLDARAGAFARWAEARLNRPNRPAYDRAIRGLVIALVALVAALGLGLLVAWVSALHPFGWVVELVLLTQLLNQRGPVRALTPLSGLADRDLDGARRVVGSLSPRDRALLDAYGVRRAALEYLAESYGREALQPLFWYALFGMPGLLAAVTLRELDKVLGFETPAQRAFGFAAARLQDAVGFLPVRLSGLLLILAALPTPHGHPAGALKTLLGDAGHHRRFNLGWPVAALAGGLGVALWGPRRLARATLPERWIGSGTAKVTEEHLAAGLYLYRVGIILAFALVAAFAVIRLSA
ncbi:MAG: cobalamin biosynthesis protein CobD/CbiB [Rhodospirillales bacterium]